MYNIITRKDAKLAGEKHYFTGKACTRGHVDKRYVSTFGCMTCGRENQHTEESKEYKRKRAAEYRKRDPEPSRLSSRKHYAANRESERVRQKKWVSDNRHLVNMYARGYRSSKGERIPSWLTDYDHLVMAETYQHSRDLYEATGIKHHVDHIYPLNGELVSGLHVSSNLQVITAFENISKSNSYEVS